MNLFIDTTYSRLILILEEQNQVIDFVQITDLPKISDLALDEVSKFLEKNKIKVQNIDNFYLTIGPGTYTGVRVGVSIVKTLKAINDKYGIFTISSLHFQAGLGNVISLLDARGAKSYLGIYQNGKNLIVDQVIDDEYIPDFAEQFQNYEVIRDYQDLNPVKNYLDLKQFFTEVKNVEDLNPVYIKSFV